MTIGRERDAPSAVSLLAATLVTIALVASGCTQTSEPETGRHTEEWNAWFHEVCPDCGQSCSSTTSRKEGCRASGVDVACLTAHGYQTPWLDIVGCCGAAAGKEVDAMCR